MFSFSPPPDRRDIPPGEMLFGTVGTTETPGKVVLQVILKFFIADLLQHVGGQEERDD